MAGIEKAYVNRKFLADCNKNQEIRLFKGLLSSSVNTSIEGITEELFEQAKNSGLIFLPITYIENDTLIAKVKMDHITNYFTLFFMYASEEDNFTDDEKLAFAVKVKGIDANLEFQDYADNYISFDMKGFDLCCRFEPLGRKDSQSDSDFISDDFRAQYSPKHDHISDPLYKIENDEKVYTNNKLIDVVDLNKKIFDQLKDTLETENPVDIETSTAEKLEILPNAKVLDSNGDVLNENGADFIDNDNNLEIISSDKIVKDDALVDA